MVRPGDAGGKDSTSGHQHPGLAEWGVQGRASRTRTSSIGTSGGWKCQTKVPRRPLSSCAGATSPPSPYQSVLPVGVSGSPSQDGPTPDLDLVLPAGGRRRPGDTGCRERQGRGPGAPGQEPEGMGWRPRRASGRGVCGAASLGAGRDPGQDGGGPSLGGPSLGGPWEHRPRPLGGRPAHPEPLGYTL